MKQMILIFITTAMLSSCGNIDQSKAMNDAKQVQSAIKKMQPGGIPTTEGGWTMTARINGKDWAATSMMPPDRAGRIFGENNGESISLDYYDRRRTLGQEKLGKGVDMMLNDDIKLWGSKEGEMEITKVDDKWIEGKFYFTAEGFETDKTIEVTDGFFRISLAKNQ